MKLNIISFDNPFPPKYGGVIDVFFKIKALHQIGFEIYLHCYIEDKDIVEIELKNITKEIFFYKINRNPFFFFSTHPFSALSRCSNNLVKNIKDNTAPILFEGLQTTYLMDKLSLNNRKIYLRLHNLEANYYLGVSKSETNWIKKVIYFTEGIKYKRFQTRISSFDRVFALSIFENDYIHSFYNKKTNYIPVFHGNSTIKNLSEFGNYAIYHGDLRISDNKKAVEFLISVFKKINDYPLIIASSSGKEFIKKKIRENTNIKFVELNNEQQLNQLLEGAHINVLLSFQKSGTKLKLINSLFNSRFCLINANIVDDPQIKSLCYFADTKNDFVIKINELRLKPYLERGSREEVLYKILSDKTNAQKIKDLIVQID